MVTGSYIKISWSYREVNEEVTEEVGVLEMKT
jgi:hypothetical protein